MGRTEKAPLCRVGRSNEPAKAGGAAVIGRASGFLETEACTTRNLAAHFGLTLAQTSLRKPSRAKQELKESYRAIRGGSTDRQRLFLDGFFDGDLRERFVDNTLESCGPFVEFASWRMDLTVAFTEELVGDIQRDKHSQAEHVTRWRRI